MKGSKTSILSTAEYISGGKNLKTKSEGIAYCLELPFGTIASSGYVNIETMNIISSDIEMNHVLTNNPINLFYCCLSNQHTKSVNIHKNNITLF